LGITSDIKLINNNIAILGGIMRDRIVFTPRKVSEGLNNLVAGLRASGTTVLKLKTECSRYIPRATDIMMNWGNSNPYCFSNGGLNQPPAIESCSNKKMFFTSLRHAGFNDIPNFVFSRDEAISSLRFPVYCRTVLSGSQGDGIVVANCVEELVDAQLYTEGLYVGREIRVHVFDGKMISFAQKKKKSTERREADGFNGSPNESVRNSHTGWVFAREGVTIPESAINIATECLRVLQLDFGAVDMVLCSGYRPKVLEVNTAPGLDGSTVDHYVEAINAYLLAQN
jgi:hypothetical protein